MRGLTAAIVLGLAVAAGPLRAQDVTVEPSAILDARQTVEPAAVLDARQTALVSIGEPQGTSGSGFFVSEEGHILTAWHAIRDLNRLSGERVTAIRRVYEINFNAAERQECRKSAILVGVSEFSDLAILQVEPSEWENRHAEPRDSCLATARPLRVRSPVRSTTLRSGESVWALGRRGGCRSGTGSAASIPCLPQPFSASPTAVTVVSERGLVQARNEVARGMSGGAVVFETGDLAGMILLSSWDQNNQTFEFVPASVLERPLWAFGISFGATTARDMLHDFIALAHRREEIDDGLRILQEMLAGFSVPDYVGMTSRTIDDVGEMVLDFQFRKRFPSAANPLRFDFLIRCIPAAGVDLVNVDPAANGVIRAKGTELANASIDKASGAIRATLLRNPNQLRGECAELFDGIVEGEPAFQPAHFVSLEIAPIAVFRQGSGLTDQTLASVAYRFDGAPGAIGQ